MKQIGDKYQKIFHFEHVGYKEFYRPMLRLLIFSVKNNIERTIFAY